MKHAARICAGDGAVPRAHCWCKARARLCMVVAHLGFSRDATKSFISS